MNAFLKKGEDQKLCGEKLMLKCKIKSIFLFIILFQLRSHAVLSLLMLRKAAASMR